MIGGALGKLAMVRAEEEDEEEEEEEKEEDPDCPWNIEKQKIKREAMARDAKWKILLGETEEGVENRKGGWEMTD